MLSPQLGLSPPSTSGCSKRAIAALFLCQDTTIFLLWIRSTIAVKLDHDSVDRSGEGKGARVGLTHRRSAVATTENARARRNERPRPRQVHYPRRLTVHEECSPSPAWSGLPEHEAECMPAGRHRLVRSNRISNAFSVCILVVQPPVLHVQNVTAEPRAGG